MRGFVGFTKRNLMLYFKDVQSVIFSLLTSIIVFVLYLLFLKGTFMDAIEGAMQGLESLVSNADIDILVSGILLTGIIGSALITIPYNCLSIIVKDRENRVDYDILATPLRRWQIILSYFMASTISAFFTTGIILTIGLTILSAMGNLHMSVLSVAAAYGVTLLGAVSATAFFMIVVLFFQSASASGAFFGILSAAAGFVIGAYIPISQFSEGVQTFCNLFPASGITVLFRNVILNGLLAEIDRSIGGIDQGMFVESIENCFSFRVSLFGNSLSQAQSVWYVAGCTAVCIFIMILIYSRTYKRK